MPRTAQSQKIHNTMVRILAEYLEREGYANICADHLAGYNQPSPIDGYLPDVTAIQNGNGCIFEVETDDSINDPHAGNQMSAFASSSLGTFTLVVPQVSMAKGEARLAFLGITGAGPWTI